MKKRRQEDQCIELRSRYVDSVRYFSVDTYDWSMQFVKCLATQKAISFHEVRWTLGAPRVEELTTEWQETEEGRFRICDWDVYDAQMRKLIGIA